MIEKVARKRRSHESDSVKDDLAYWLSKTSDERVSAVEILRRQYDGNSTRLQRVVRIVEF